MRRGSLPIARHLFTPLLLLAACCQFAWSAPYEIQNDIEQIIRDGQVGATEISVTVLDPVTGDMLAAVDDDRRMIPASNMKLLTSGATLITLGADFNFRTVVAWLPGDGGGKLVVRGDGDPAFGDPELLLEQDLGIEDFLGAIVEAVKAEGITEIGELVIDDRIFDDERIHASWPLDQLNRWYCAEVSGLNFHTNIINVFARPGEAGRPPAITLEPSAPWLNIVNGARSVTKGSHTAWVARDLKSNRMTLKGDIRWASDPVEVAVHDPAMFFAEVLAHRLGSAGVRPRHIRRAEPGDILPSGRPVLVIETPLEVVMRRCNFDSYNLYAEAMLKRIGFAVTGMPGSWRNGAAVVRLVMLEHLGASTSDEIVVADGSGMSRENRVTTRMLARWLKVLLEQDPAVRDAFIESLATTGRDGTLRKRFREVDLDNDIHAKTGYLTGVTALSGYLVQPGTQRTVIFSIVTNNKPSRVPLANVRLTEERIVKRVDRWLNGE